jgi:hypothetical protein
MILGANPEYAKIKDKNGLLPLHKAIDQERSSHLRRNKEKAIYFCYLS